MTTITAEERARWRSRLNANSGLYNIHLKDMLRKALDALEIAEKELKAARTAVRECEEGWTNHSLEMERAAPLTKHGRATWWATIESHVQRGNAVGCAVGMKINATDVLRLLELIEAVEARATIERQRACEVSGHLMQMSVDLNETVEINHALKKRAEKAEAERDVLARKLMEDNTSLDHGHEFPEGFQPCFEPKADVHAVWLWIDWAAQEVERQAAENRKDTSSP